MNYPAAICGVSEGGVLRSAQHDPFDKTQGHGEVNRTMTDQCHSEAESRRISLQIRSKLRGINP